MGRKSVTNTRLTIHAKPARKKFEIIKASEDGLIKTFYWDNKDGRFKRVQIS